MCSVGRRGELMKDFRASMEEGSRIIATDNSPYAPALYFADKQYIVPRIDAPEYMDVILILVYLLIFLKIIYLKMNILIWKIISIVNVNYLI